MITVNPHLIRTTEGLPDDIIWAAVETDGHKSDQQKICARFANQIARARGFKRAAMISSGATVETGRIEYRYGYILTGGVR